MIRPILIVACWALAVDPMAASAAAPAIPIIDLRMKSSRCLTAYLTGWSPFLRNGSRGRISGQFSLGARRLAHSDRLQPTFAQGDSRWADLSIFEMRHHLRREHLHIPLRQLVGQCAELQHGDKLAGAGLVAELRKLI